MKIKTRKWLSGFCIAACLLCVGAGIRLSAADTATASVGVLQADTVIEEKYSLGAEFVIPEGDIVCENGTYSAETYYLKTPDGRVYEGREHTLAQLGVHTVVYSAGSGAAMATAEQSFTVIQATYGLSSNFSTATYAESLTRNVGSGMQVSLADGDTFTFNQPIDVTETSEYFSFYPYASYYSDVVTADKPNGGYTYDIAANKYVVRLTDCYDADNYIETEIAIVVANRAEVPYSNCTYIRAGMGTQTKAGMQAVDGDKKISSPAREVYADGVRYQVWYGATYGTGGRRGSIEKIPACSLKFDAETNCLYFSYGGGWNLINDLDNMDVNDVAFEGFTTGEVYLSVYAGDYLRSTTEFEVAQIGEYANEELNLSAECQDTKAPELVVDAPFDSNTKFYAAKGETLPVFDAWATDIHLVGDVTARVFYAYDTNKPTQVFLKDGQFTPDREGDYTIVYTATDASGNVTEKTVTFMVIDAKKAIALSVEKLESLQAGLIYTLPEHSITSINDETVEVSISAVFENDEKNKMDIDSVTREFLVEQVGTYAIKYVCKGVLTTTEYVYEVESVSAGNIRIDKSGVYLPEYLIKNAAYTLDEVHAYRYEGKTPTEVDCQYYVSEDGNAEREIDPANYTVQANSTVRFKYVSTTAVEYSETISVVDVGFGETLVMENYFLGDVAKESKSAYIEFTAKATSGDSTMKFISDLSFNAFSIALKVPEGKDGYSSFDVIMTDVYDASVSCVLKFAKADNGNMVLSVNDGAAVDMGIAFTANRYTSVSYAPTTNKFTVLGGVSLDCPVAFTTDKVAVQMRFSGINGVAGIEIQSLNSQRMSKMARDNVKPSIAYDDAEKGERDINTVITVLAPQVSDVLSPYLQKNLTLKVSLPNGNYATSLGGETLDGDCYEPSYQIKLSEYGKYQVDMAYVDQAGNEITASYAIYVSDRTAPTIVIDDGYDETTVLKKPLDDTFTIAGYSVDDDFGKDGLTSWVLVISPLNEMTVTDAGEDVQLNQVGRWKICYYCHDAEFNSAMRYYYIDVE